MLNKIRNFDNIKVDDVYNKADVINLLSESLAINLGEKINRVSWDVGINDEIIVVINGKKWSIKIDAYKEKDNAI